MAVPLVALLLWVATLIEVPRLIVGRPKKTRLWLYYRNDQQRHQPSPLIFLLQSSV